MAPSIEEELQSIYKPLNGITIEGTYHERMEMPSTGNVRDVIKGIDSSTKIILEEISTSVLTKYRTKVWKGITGPQDSARYTEYWLWVACLPDLVEEKEYRFRVTDISVFSCWMEKAPFDYGVSIALEKIN